MGLFTNDTLTDSDGTLLHNHTGERGATWTKYPGYASFNTTITGNLAHSNGSDSPTYYASGVPQSANYYLQVTVYLASTVADDAFFMYGRMDTAVSPNQDQYYYGAYSMITGVWSINKGVSGTYTELGTYAETLVDTTSYFVALEMIGTAIKLYVNVERISVTDSSITAAGRGGFSPGNQSTSTAGLQILDYFADDGLSLTPFRRGMSHAILAR